MSSSQHLARVVCIEPYQEMVEQRVAEWRRKFSNLQAGKEIVSLTGETSANLRLLEKGDAIVCTPAAQSVIISMCSISLLSFCLCCSGSSRGDGVSE